ncbi:MAG: DUF3488 and transglutaminase-like domain-containing protein [Proteobacteria bacterium]|nr:DUF3488 and transglutaminase-like domain-containing protein [Pseudomonadota bacterium]
MRFAYAHKFTTYLMVFCAYFALVLSGELSPIISILAFLAIVGSWLWEAPRVRLERFALAWTIVSLLVLVYSLISAFTGGEFLLIGGEFLLYLLVAKLFNRRSCKDYLHVYVITFLMLVAGTVLNSEFTYGAFFLGYVVAATWALILFHLRREMEDNFLLKHSDDRPSERVEVTRILNSRRIVGRGFFIGTSLVSLTIFAIASLLFLMIPRIGFGLFFQKNRSGLTMVGFSDGIQLGGHGTIKNDPTVVMRVEIDDEYKGRRAPYIHWRGVAFDRYENGRWLRSRKGPPTVRQVTYPRIGKERHHLLYDNLETVIPEALDQRADRGTRQQIYLEPIGYDVLFGASMPLAFEFDARLGMRSPRSERNDEMRFAHAAGIRYVVYSAIDSPDVQSLRNAPKRLPPGYRSYLQFPPEITDRVKKLANEITREAKTDYDKAVAITSWLKTNLSYTLQMRSPGDLEPIDFFLFERKQGHCEYFSSAMAVMLRTVGVPARNVNGFLGGEWNEYNDYIAVRAGDAHSWVEVYFHGIGWVTFDPTPSAEIDRLGRGSSSVGDRMRRLLDTLRFKWFKWVIEYDLYRQLSLFRSLRDSMSGRASSVKKWMTAIKEWLAHHLETILAVVGMSIAISVLLWLRNRRRSHRGIGYGSRKASDPMSVLYNAVLARLARRGHRRAPPATPLEHSRALTRAGMPGASEFAELTELYYRAVYGTASTAELLPRAQSLSESIDRAFRDTKQGDQKRARS